MFLIVERALNFTIKRINKGLKLIMFCYLELIDFTIKRINKGLKQGAITN